MTAIDLTCADEARCTGVACCPTLVDGGLFGRAARFDGVGNRFFAASNDAFSFFNTGSFTVELWLKVDFEGALPDRRLRVVTKDQGSPPTQRGSVLGLEPADGTEAANVSFTRYDETQRYQLKWRGAERLAQGDFVHFVLTYDAMAATTALYVDGAPAFVSETGAPSTAPDPASPLVIGNAFTGGQRVQGHGRRAYPLPDCPRARARHGALRPRARRPVLGSVRRIEQV